MVNPKNRKMNSNERNQVTKLRSILNEVHKTQIAHVKRMRKYSHINETALNNILSSGVLSLQETKVLSLYFNRHKIRSINERVINRVDSDIKFLSEGLVDFFKKAGDKAKEAFVSGWTAVKGIWKNFSDVVKEFIEKMKDMFVKVKDWVMTKVKALASKVSGIVNEQFISKFKSNHPHEHMDLKTEFGQAKQTADHLTTYFVKNLQNGTLYQDKITNGTVEPKGEVDGIPEPDAAKGETELKQEAFNIYNSIFSNKQNLRELMRLPLTETGHLTDNIKNPIVKQIAEYCVFILKAILSPLSTIVAAALKTITKNFMETASKFSKALNGPGIFKFAIMSLLVAEIFEAVEDLFATVFQFQGLLSVITPFLGPLGFLAEGLHLPLHIGHIAVGSYALLTVIYNMKPLFDKAAGEEGDGGEPEVQTAGYKPQGQFKLKEGKLIFIP